MVRLGTVERVEASSARLAKGALFRSTGEESENEAAGAGQL